MLRTVNLEIFFSTVCCFITLSLSQGLMKQLLVRTGHLSDSRVKTTSFSQRSNLNLPPLTTTSDVTSWKALNLHLNSHACPDLTHCYISELSKQTTNYRDSFTS